MFSLLHLPMARVAKFESFPIFLVFFSVENTPFMTRMTLGDLWKQVLSNWTTLYWVFMASLKKDWHWPFFVRKGQKSFAFFVVCTTALKRWKSVRFKRNLATLALYSFLFVAGWLKHTFVCFSELWPLFILNIASRTFAGICRSYVHRLSFAVRIWE